MKCLPRHRLLLAAACLFVAACSEPSKESAIALPAVPGIEELAGQTGDYVDSAYADLNQEMATTHKLALLGVEVKSEPLSAGSRSDRWSGHDAWLLGLTVPQNKMFETVTSALEALQNAHISGLDVAAYQALTAPRPARWVMLSAYGSSSNAAGRTLEIQHPGITDRETLTPILFAVGLKLDAVPLSLSEDSFKSMQTVPKAAPICTPVLSVSPDDSKKEQCSYPTQDFVCLLPAIQGQVRCETASVFIELNKVRFKQRLRGLQASYEAALKNGPASLKPMFNPASLSQTYGLMVEMGNASLQHLGRSHLPAKCAALSTDKQRFDCFQSDAGFPDFIAKFGKEIQRAREFIQEANRLNVDLQF